MSQASTRTHSILMLLLAAAILPAVVGCEQKGYLLQDSDFEVRHPAVVWVYSAGSQYVDPPARLPYAPLGLPFKNKNEISSLQARASADMGVRTLVFIEDYDKPFESHRAQSVVLDIKTGLPHLGAGEVDYGKQVSFKEVSRCIGDCLGDGRYRLVLSNRAKSVSAGIAIGREDQPAEDYTKLLVFAKHVHCPGIGFNDAVLLNDGNHVALVLRYGFLVLLDLSKLPPPVETTTRDAATESE